ncbi:hypothetical protein RI367_006560 [Sorochytrium milnesiophthora]
MGNSLSYERTFQSGGRLQIELSFGSDAARKCPEKMPLKRTHCGSIPLPDKLGDGAVVTVDLGELTAEGVVELTTWPSDSGNHNRVIGHELVYGTDSQTLLDGLVVEKQSLGTEYRLVAKHQHPKHNTPTSKSAVTLKLYLPQRVASDGENNVSLHIRTRNTNIVQCDATLPVLSQFGGHIFLHSVSGDIKLGKVSNTRHLSVQSHSGGIKLEQLCSSMSMPARVHLESVTGDIHLGNISDAGCVKLATSSGNVHADLVSSNGHVEVSTVSGGVRLDMIPAAHSVALRSASADVCVGTVVAHSRLAISTVSGNIKSRHLLSGGAVELSSVSGTVRTQHSSDSLSGIAFRNALSVSSSSGLLDLSQVVVMNDSNSNSDVDTPAKVTLTTSSGDIAVKQFKTATVAPRGFDVQASSSSGSTRFRVAEPLPSCNFMLNSISGATHIVTRRSYTSSCKEKHRIPITLEF